LLGWFAPDVTFIPFFFDKIEVLPDGDIVEQQYILDYKTEEFYYYYNVWENYHFFGLPHGKGWVNEPEWLIEFLKSFEKAYRKFQNWEIEKASK
jgi:hypothetical protein